MPVIGARLGYGVDETGVGPADLGIKTAADHLELPHRGQRKEKYGIIAATLVALQRIIEVLAIQRDVRIDGPLSGDHQAVAV